ESNDDKKPHPPVKCMYCPKTYDHEIATRMQAQLDNDCQIKYFKLHSQLMAKLKRIQQKNNSKEISLVLPAITRWGTHFEYLQSIKKSKIALEQALMDIRIRENINSDLRNYILSDEF
ncbi:12050_t:CDS:2, partial [Cetraspora pellucida]